MKNLLKLSLLIAIVTLTIQSQNSSQNYINFLEDTKPIYEMFSFNNNLNKNNRSKEQDRVVKSSFVKPHADLDFTFSGNNEERDLADDLRSEFQLDKHEPYLLKALVSIPSTATAGVDSVGLQVGEDRFIKAEEGGLLIQLSKLVKQLDELKNNNYRTKEQGKKFIVKFRSFQLKAARRMSRLTEQGYDWPVALTSSLLLSQHTTDEMLSKAKGDSDQKLNSFEIFRRFVGESNEVLSSMDVLKTLKKRIKIKGMDEDAKDEIFAALYTYFKGSLSPSA